MPRPRREFDKRGEKTARADRTRATRVRGESWGDTSNPTEPILPKEEDEEREASLARRARRHGRSRGTRHDAIRYRARAVDGAKNNKVVLQKVLYFTFSGRDVQNTPSGREDIRRRGCLRKSSRTHICRNRTANCTNYFLSPCLIQYTTYGKPSRQCRTNGNAFRAAEGVVGTDFHQSSRVDLCALTATCKAFKAVIDGKNDKQQDNLFLNAIDREFLGLFVEVEAMEVDLGDWSQDRRARSEDE